MRAAATAATLAPWRAVSKKKNGTNESGLPKQHRDSIGAGWLSFSPVASGSGRSPDSAGLAGLLTSPSSSKKHPQRLYKLAAQDALRYCMDMDAQLT